jgi:cytoskeletal protein CcmA (bactofilin family)
MGNQPEPNERRTTAWIGKSVTIKGDVVSAEDLTIDGQVEGTITLHANSLAIGPGAAIQGELHARTVTVAGAVTGRVSATERIEIRETGSVDGDIQAPRLAVREGAMLRGRIETGAVGKPDAQRFPRAV